MIKRLLYLNGLATLAVVLYHASGWGFTAMFWWPHRYLPVSSPNFDQMGSLPYYLLRLVEQLIIFAIPSFLFVSGFFIAFAAGRKGAPGWGLLGSRIKYLLLPYLFWSLVMLAGEGLQGEILSPVEYLKRLLFGQTTPAFYYVPLLCQLYLLSPLIVRLARARWRPLLFGTGVLHLVVQGIWYAGTLGVELPAAQLLLLLTPGWFFPGNIFWFTFGVVAGFHLPALKQRLFALRRLLPPLLLLLLPLGMMEWEFLLARSGESWLSPKETLVDNLYALLFILCFISFDRLSYPLAGAFTELGGRSFGIYLVHSAVLAYTARLIYHLVPALLAHQFLFQPILILLGLGIPLLLMAAARRSPARRFYAYQFG